MEERLFWIGIAMGAYSWATKRWTKKGVFDARLSSALWHSAFYALAGFAVTLIAVLSLESRVRFSSAPGGLLSPSELLPAVAGGALLGAWGFWSAFRHGAKAEARRRMIGEDLEWAETVFSAVLLAAFLMYFVVQAFKIPSGSMEETLKIGDHLFVNKFIYGVRIPFTKKRLLPLREVGRGDIVVFRFPTEKKDEAHCGSDQYGKDFIKRVIGLPGERIEIKEGAVFVDGKKLEPEPYARFADPIRYGKASFPIPAGQYQELWVSRQLDTKIGDMMRDHFGPVTVPAGSYFVMGDNRDRSCDGRFWGPVQNHYLKGKAWIIYWPPSRMGGIS